MVDVPFARQSCDASKRWRVAFSAAFMNLVQTGSFFFTPTTLMPLIISDFRLSLSLSTVPIAVGKIVYVLLLLPGGIIVDNYGPRKCVIVGIAGIGILLVLYASAVISYGHIILAHVGLAAFSSLSGVPVYSLFIAEWFQERVGLAMGLVLAGYSAAGTAVPAILGPVASEMGWRAAMGSVGFFVLIVGLPIAYLFLEENQSYASVLEPISSPELHPLLHRSNAHGSFAHNSRVPSHSGGDRVWEQRALDNNRDRPLMTRQISAALLMEALDKRPADQSWSFLGFALNYILLQYAFGSLSENILFFLTIDRGFSLSFSSLFFSTLNLAAFSAKLVGGHLGDKFDRFRVAMVTSGLAGFGVMILFFNGGLNEHNLPVLTTSPIALVAFSVVFGFGYGATFNCLYALVPIIFGRRNLGRTQSALFGLGLAGNAVGSIATGMLRSRYGTYDRAFLIASISTWTNLVVFAVTKHFAGGSVEMLKEESVILPKETASDLEFQISDPDFLRRYGGDSVAIATSFHDTIPATGTPGFFGAVFQPSPSAESLVDVGTSAGLYYPLDSLSRVGSEHLLGHVSSSLYNDTSHRRYGDHDDSLRSDIAGEGVEFESGFPFPRTWSHGSLRRIEENKRQTDDCTGTQLPYVGSPQQRRAGIPYSITFENLLQSGILSSSMEDIGYVGNMPTMRRPVTLSDILQVGSPDMTMTDTYRDRLHTDQMRASQATTLSQSHTSLLPLESSATGQGVENGQS